MASMSFDLDTEADENGLPIYHFHAAASGLDASSDEVYMAIQGNNLDLTTTQMGTVAAAVKSALEAITGVATVTQTEIWYTES